MDEELLLKNDLLNWLETQQARAIESCDLHTLFGVLEYSKLFHENLSKFESDQISKLELEKQLHNVLETAFQNLDNKEGKRISLETYFKIEKELKKIKEN